ncbi:hypothetical protein HDU97_010269 [Phlyctochytrium planicorne]|nr:hypothetical protein HDU97_010269 [Phlyctochytrium planicorne]
MTPTVNIVMKGYELVSGATHTSKCAFVERSSIIPPRRLRDGDDAAVTLTFNIKLPPWLPSSVQTNRCQIWYELQAFASSRSGRFEFHAVEQISMLRVHDKITTSLKSSSETLKNWKENGFDMAIRAPSYAFISPFGCDITILLKMRVLKPDFSIKSITVGLFEARRLKWSAGVPLTSDADSPFGQDVEMIPIGSAVKARFNNDGVARVIIPADSDSINPPLTTRNIRIYHLLGIVVTYAASSGKTEVLFSEDSDDWKSNSTIWKGMRRFVNGKSGEVKHKGYAVPINLLHSI